MPHLVSFSLCLLCSVIASGNDPFELIPREDPLTPEQSMAKIELDGDYQLELVAAEPLIADPVEIQFDASGRLYVAEMRDYPIGPVKGRPPLSRIRLLEDTNGDGKMDTSKIWADELEFVQGLILVNGGLLVSTWNAILFLKDSDDDGLADVRETIYRSDEPRHSQVIVSSPRWGPGLRIYFNNGLDTSFLADPNGNRQINIERSGFAIDPYRNWEVKLVEGRGQHGASFDDFGDYYFTTNRNPLIMTVLPREAIRRNPFSGLASGQVDVYPSASKIYPAQITLTASSVHAGTYTAACGTHIYRGHALADLQGNAFVCDPTAQVVSRHALHPQGGIYTATALRSRPQTEFFRSRDAWSRPVNVSTGPDGALYVCDMYRRFIDHPMFLPDDYSERFDMQTGNNLGRIYRIVPNEQAPSVNSTAISSRSPSTWVERLDHPNAWHRSTASRLLREYDRPPFAEIDALLRDPKAGPGRSAAFHLLRSTGRIDAKRLSNSLDSGNPELTRAAIDYLVEHPDFAPPLESKLLSLTEHANARLAYMAVVALGSIESRAVSAKMAQLLARSPSDDWVLSAVLSHRSNIGPAVLIELINRFGAQPLPPTLVARLAEPAGREADPQDLSALLSALDRPLPPATHFAILNGIDAGLRYQERLPQIRSLRDLLTSKNPALDIPESAVRALVERASVIALDPNASEDDRIAAIGLARTLPDSTALALMGRLSRFDQSAAIQSTAMELANHLPRSTVAEFVFEKWNQLGSTAQTAALTFLNSNDATRLLLLERMQAGDIPKSLLDPMSRWRYLRSKNDSIRSVATKLFGNANHDRESLVREYHNALSSKSGEPERGRERFQTNCALCHTFKGEGFAVGPDITDIRNKPLSGLLTDVLDPNRVVETRFGSYHIELNDGRSFLGLISDENENGITLVAPGIEETIPYKQIKSKRATGLSLMPPGLENALDVQAMADLIAYLTQ